MVIPEAFPSRQTSSIGIDAGLAGGGGAAIALDVDKGKTGVTNCAITEEFAGGLSPTQHHSRVYSAFSNRVFFSVRPSTCKGTCSSQCKSQTRP
jgi:hypothetical protein